MIALFAALLAIVPVTNNSVSYACDGSTATFSVNFPYIVNTDLVVTATTSGGAVTTLTPTTDWTIALTTLQSGSTTLTVNVPATKCPSGSTLKIANSPVATQPFSFRAQTQYNTALHEQAYDRTIMIIQNALNFAKTCPAHSWVNGWSGLLSPTCSQPSFSDISGTISVTNLSGVMTQAQGGTGSGALTCTNQFLSSNGTAYSCVTDTLASAQHLNQGTTSTVLHGNAAGNPAWGSVVLTTDVSGTLPDANLANSYSGVGVCSAHTFASTLARNAGPTCTQPTFSDLSAGVATAAQGGMGAAQPTCAANAFLTCNGTTCSCSQPQTWNSDYSAYFSGTALGTGKIFSQSNLGSSFFPNIRPSSAFATVVAAGSGTGTFTAKLCADGTTCAAGNIQVTCSIACPGTAGNVTTCTINQAVVQGEPVSWSLTSVCTTTQPQVNFDLSYGLP